VQEPGQKLRRVRENLRLRYREVEEASQQIATQYNNHEFLIGLSRLADIENKGTVPSVYRLYSLCVIYRLDFATVLEWYGISLEELSTDAARLPLQQTHLINLRGSERAQVEFPSELDEGFDLSQTSYLTRHIQRWGRLPLTLLNALDLRRHRYGFIGTDDWSMYPILSPGSFVQIDETRRRITNEGWLHENERPIYFLEHRDGYRCSWCTQTGGMLIIQPHYASHIPPEILKYPGEAEVIGQVVGMAMRLDAGKRRHTHS
jgi:transcriptional regulator with XRE-family HTH domain